MNISELSLKQLRDLKRKDLDDKWKHKYPDGLWYYFKYMTGEEAIGHLTGRPTSHSISISWCYGFGRNDGYYVSKSYWAIVEHKVFSNRESFESFAKTMR